MVFLRAQYFKNGSLRGLQGGRKLSAMVRGMDNGGSLRVFDYEPEQVEEVFLQFLGKIED